MGSKNGIVAALLVCVSATHLSISALEASERTSGHADEILKIHEALLASHLQNSAEGVLADEADEIVVVTRGEVLFATKKDRTRQFADYLACSKFEQYRDLITPIVRVSEDGTMAWLIAQVQIVGVQTVGDDERVPIESTWAWIELYEKRDGRWVRVGEVSSIKPPDSGGAK